MEKGVAVTDVWNDPSNEDGQQQQGNDPGSLRKALEAANKRNKALEEANVQLQTGLRSTNLNLSLAANGVDPKRFAQHVPADLDVTDEAVKGWIKDNKDVFNFGTVTPESVTPAPGEQQPASSANQQQAANTQEAVSTDPLAGIDPGLIDALTRMGVLSDRSQALSGAERAQLAEQVGAATPKSFEDAKSLLAGLGIETQDSGGYKF